MTVVDDLVALYAGPTAHQLYDEAVTELEHALQCAALAVDAGVPDDLTAAALLHDVGHLLLDDNVSLTEQLTADHGHEAAGARYLATHGFPPSVTGAGRAARRSEAVPLCRRTRLRCIAVTVVGSQPRPAGRPDGRCRGQRRSSDGPAPTDAVAIRRWDDRGKVDGLDVGDFDRYVAMLASLVRR